MGRRVPADPGLAADEQRVDGARYLAAIRRSGWLIGIGVAGLAMVVLFLSLVLPKSYSATSTIVVDEQADAATTMDAESTARRLATVRTLLTSRDVLAAAARDLPGESLDSLRDKVSASVDSSADIIRLKAVDGEAPGAAAIANGVARTFLSEQRTAQRRQAAQTEQDLRIALERSQAAGSSAEEQQALRQRLSQLAVDRAAPGSDLRIAQAAIPPEGADSPKPLQNVLFACLAGLFIGVLAALARDLIAPRVSDVKQLTTLTGLSPLVVLPSSWRPRVADINEAYEALAASLCVQLSESQRVVLVTSASADEDRSAVAVGLACALAASGVPTVAVSADLRHSRLHEELGVTSAPGLSDALVAAELGDEDTVSRILRATARSGESAPDGALRTLPSGRAPRHPPALLSGEVLGTVLDALARPPCRYVVVEGPPLLGPIDGQLVARWADAVLVVCRLDRLAPSDADELGQMLVRLDAPVLGAVVIGGHRVRYNLPAWTPVRAPSDV